MSADTHRAQRILNAARRSYLRGLEGKIAPARASTKRTKRKYDTGLEYDEQALFVDWLKVVGLNCFAVANGALLRGDKWTRARQMAQLKKTGLRPGAPDLVIIEPPPLHPESNRKCTPKHRHHLSWFATLH